jgi:serine/threonine protein kinase
VTDTLRDQLQLALGDAYTLGRELGGGGMSMVFVARETALDRDVVVKVLPNEMAGHLSLERFKREITLAARLQHPHIVPMLTAGDANGLPFFTMPLIEGESLRARLEREGELPLSDAVRLLREVASALAYAHELGIMHRDIKPDNVLVSAGSAMVTDFGVAKAVSESAGGGSIAITGTGMAIGTPAYMAPEQASADPSVDHRADIYAWGVLAYELLTGRPPFAGRTPAAMFAAHMTEAPELISKRRASVPPALATLVMSALEKRPSDRPQSAASIVTALDAMTAPGTSSTAARTSVNQRPLRLLIAGAIVGVAAIAALLFIRSRKPSELGTIAVIPVLSAGTDTTQADAVDGVADDLSSSLHLVPNVRVISRNSANHFKARTIDTKAAASALGVDHIVELTMRETSGAVRVAVDVVNASDGVSTWTKSFESDRAGLSALGDRIASTITDELHLRKAETGIAPTHQPTAAAYEAYAREMFYIRRSAGKPDFDSAMVNFRRAVAADPNFASPYVAAARFYAEIPGEFAGSMQYDHAQSDSLVRRALQIDPSNADAHAMLAYTKSVLDWDWDGAKREFDTALRLDPSSEVAHVYRAMFLMSRGELASASQEARAAVNIDPYHAFASSILGITLNYRNLPDSALIVARQLDAIAPGSIDSESL